MSKAATIWRKKVDISTEDEKGEVEMKIYNLEKIKVKQSNEYL